MKQCILFLAIGGVTYTIIDVGDWDNSQAACVMTGATLAVFDNEEDYKVFIDALSGSGVSDNR